VVTIGNFDGVHLGHVRLLRRTVQIARQVGTAAVAFTFDPHPAAILQPQNPPLPLTARGRKLDLLRPLGLDAVLVYPTDRQLLSLSWREFLEELLLKKLRIRGIVEGPDFRFGRNREGDWQLLEAWARERGVWAELVPAVVVDGHPVSSSRIRALISAGEVSAANRLLSEPYRIQGRVVVGAKRGRTLGFPTANLADVTTILPAQGIYAGRAYLAEGTVVYPAAISIGPNPTFEETGLKIEAYLLDFEGTSMARQSNWNSCPDCGTFKGSIMFKCSLSKCIGMCSQLERLRGACCRSAPRPCSDFRRDKVFLKVWVLLWRRIPGKGIS
jgi:riboflavin kinase/FMN adenylyltransferase